MGLFLKILIYYLIGINIFSSFVAILDKYKAVTNKWRVKEKTLLFFAIIGGSVGMYITMQLIRHKTRHLKFMLGIPIIFLFQIILIIFILNFSGVV